MTTHRNTRRPAAQRGLSLTESLIGLAIAAVTCGSVVPGFQRAVEHRRLEGAAAQLETEMQMVRSLAVARNESLRYSFQDTPAGGCYVVHTGPAGACRCEGGVPVCSAGAEAIRSESFGADGGLRVASSARSFLFDATHGTVTPTTTIELRGPGSQALRLVVNVTGRIRSCSPSGLAGYRAC